MSLSCFFRCSSPLRKKPVIKTHGVILGYQKFCQKAKPIWRLGFLRGLDGTVPWKGSKGRPKKGDANVNSAMKKGPLVVWGIFGMKYYTVSMGIIS